MFDTRAAIDALKAAIDARLAWEALPNDIRRTRDGWAGYKGGRRITRFYFSEAGARDAATAWDASDIKVQF